MEKKPSILTNVMGALALSGLILSTPVEAFAQDPVPDTAQTPPEVDSPVVMPWDCDVEAHKCNGDHIKAAIDHVAQTQGISAPFLTCLVDKESQFDPYNVSKTNDHGPVQFHLNAADRYHPRPWTLMDTTPWAGESVYAPLPSVSAAAWLINKGVTTLSRGGWTTYPMCAHLR